jgi:hypothetical protein
MSGWVAWMEEKRSRQKIYDHLLKNFWKRVEATDRVHIAQYEHQKQQEKQHQQQQNNEDDWRQQQQFFEEYLRSSSSHQPTP